MNKSEEEFKSQIDWINKFRQFVRDNNKDKDIFFYCMNYEDFIDKSLRDSVTGQLAFFDPPYMKQKRDEATDYGEFSKNCYWTNIANNIKKFISINSANIVALTYGDCKGFDEFLKNLNLCFYKRKLRTTSNSKLDERTEKWKEWIYLVFHEGNLQARETLEKIMSPTL